MKGNVIRGGLDISDRLTVCRQNGVADTSTRVDLGGTAFQKSRQGKIRLRLGGLNNVRPRENQ